MEHWRTPDGFTDTVDIPYVCTEDYDGGDFCSYPQRKLGSVSQPDELTPPTSGNDFDQLTSFIQTWLFFGCVIEVFRIVGIKLKTSDFLRDKRRLYITTKSLPKFIQQWREFEASSKLQSVKTYPKGSALPVELQLPEGISWRDDCRDARLETNDRRSSFNQKIELRTADGRYSYIRKILLRVRACWRRRLKMTAMSDETIEQQQQLNPESSDKVWLSIMALEYTLMESARKIYDKGPPDHRPWGFSHILRERMIQRGWCKGECAIFERDLPLEVLYYIGCVSSPRRDQYHGDCTIQRCIGGTVTGTYVTQHCLQDCHCEQMQVDVDKVVEFIQAGKIPLISWDGTKMSVIEYNGSTKYVAISHVWSDGMGNASRNALPQCQLNRIQGFIRELYSVVCEENYLGRTFGPRKFLDGPVKLPEHDPLEHPVGFWMDTLCVPVQEVHKSSRKQAILQMRSIYEFAHRVLVIDDWIHELDREASVVEKGVRLYLSNWQHRLWTLQEGVLAQNLFFRFKDRSQTIEELIIEWDKDKESCPGFYCSILDYTLIRVPTANLLLTDKIIPAHSPSALFTPLLSDVRYRTTTRKEDETICMATLLPGMNLEALLSKVQTDEGSGANRAPSAVELMERFLLQIGRFDKFFIFNNMPRLQSEGYGWAPASFLGQAGKVLASVDSRNPLGCHLNRGGALGLQVTFPGVVFNRHPQLLKFKDSDSVVSRINVEVWREEHRYHFTLILQPRAKDLNPNRLSSDWKQFALIIGSGQAGRECSGRSSLRSRRKDEPSLAILGLLDLEDDGSGHMRIWHVTTARLEWNPRQPPATRSTVVTGDWVKEQQWSVL